MEMEDFIKRTIEREKTIKPVIIDLLIKSFSQIGIDCKGPSLIKISDINQIVSFVKSIMQSGLTFGFDMFDGSCSGNSKITIIDNKRLALKMLDLSGKEFAFVVKTMYVLISTFDDIDSPVIIFESNEDIKMKTIHHEEVKEENRLRHYSYVESAVVSEGFESENVFDVDEVNELKEKDYYGDISGLPSYFFRDYFLDRKIFACIDIEHLESPFDYSKFLFYYSSKELHDFDSFFEKLVSKK